MGIITYLGNESHDDRMEVGPALICQTLFCQYKTNKSTLDFTALVKFKKYFCLGDVRKRLGL